MAWKHPQKAPGWGVHWKRAKVTAQMPQKQLEKVQMPATARELATKEAGPWRAMAMQVEVVQQLLM